MRLSRKVDVRLPAALRARLERLSTGRNRVHKLPQDHYPTLASDRLVLRENGLQRSHAQGLLLRLLV